jgi:hypothetical protein
MLTMSAIALEFDQKLKQWTPETVSQVERLVHELIETVDKGNLDIFRSRHVEEEVLKLLDEP